jgi:hypothetical protein
VSTGHPPPHLVCVSVKKKGPSIYTVDPVKRTCNCLDWWYRGDLCKHLRAAMATPPLPAERFGDFVLQQPI